MFDDHPQVEGTANRACRPDPEEILKHIRISKEEVLDALGKTRILGEARIPSSKQITEGLTNLVGQLTIRLWELDRQEDQTLAQMDEEPK